MTREQIAELEKGSVCNCQGMDPEWEQTCPADLALARLLEEREKLLVAVRAAVKNAFDDDPQEWQRIDEAIAFAEAEAKP